MSRAVDLRAALADHSSASSLAARFRTARWALLLRRFPELEDMRVLDLGGTIGAWRAAPVRPNHVTLINLTPEHEPFDEERFCAVEGDACDPPAELSRQRFDLVYSNSAIEHLGGHFRRSAFARVVETAAPHHWVQTPYRYFPMEPHWLFPGFQFLPLRARCLISQRWRLGWYSRPGEDLTTVVEGVLEIELLSATEMHHYFPSSELLKERLMGFTKSLVAVK